MSLLLFFIRNKEKKEQKCEGKQMNENVKVVFGLIPIFSKFVACISPKGHEIAVIVNEKIHSPVYPRRSKITHKQTGKGNNIIFVSSEQ